MNDFGKSATEHQDVSLRISIGILAVILAMFFALRMPLAIANNGEVDEDWFTVPGWTILQNGIPQIPYAPERDPTGVFYQGDKILFGMPPGFFYWEAIFFAALSPGYTAGRIASMVPGAITVVLVFVLGKQLLKDSRIGLLAAAIYSLSRVFYFPATAVRPDMLCAMFGGFSVLFIYKWSEELKLRWLLCCGACCGLGLLTHPFAAVFCLQCGTWVLLRKRDDFHHRVVSATALTSFTILFLVPWAALILLDPDLFKVQFTNNVLNRTQSGLVQRFLMFWEPLIYHIEFLNYRTLLPQMVLMIAGLATSTVLLVRQGARWRAILFFTWTSIYFLVGLQGKHPTMGYWCYPAIFIFLCVAHVVMSCFDKLPRNAFGVFAKLFITGLLCTTLFLGSGVRYWYVTVTNWDNPTYNSRVLVKQLLAEYPADARYLVDRSYVFDFYLAGRDTLLALNDKGFFQVAGIPYDYLVINPTESRPELPQQLNAKLMRSYGDREHISAEVYAHPRILERATSRP